MKHLTLIITLLTLASCGLVKQEKVKKFSVDEQITPYYERFAELNGQDADDLEMKFAKTITNADKSLITLGYCQKGSKRVFKADKTMIYETPVVVLNKERWDVMTPADRERLVFHELGHCLLNRNHDDTLAPVMIGRAQYNLPKSLMSTYFIDTTTSNLIGYNNLISELFSRPSMNVAWDGQRYAPMAASTMNVEELEDVVVPELHDCTHDTGHEVIDERTPASNEEV